MITIVAKNFVQKDKIEEFKKLTKTLIEKSRKEEGCISYNLFEDIEDECVLTFIEEWKSFEDIDIHNSSPHFKSIVPKLDDLCQKSAVVNLYTVVSD